jgi:CBS domain containing-hemolysin-like protein
VTTVALAAIVVLVLVNGFFVAAEFALVSARKEQLTGASGATRLARRQMERLDAYLSACQLGITIASLALGAIGEPTLARLLEGPLGSLRLAHLAAILASILALLIMTTLHITVGEQAPKSFAIGSAERVAILCAWPLELFYRALRPLVLLLNAASNGIVRLFGGTPATTHGEATLEELRHLIAEVGSSGSLDRTDYQLLRGVFTLDERTAEEVMTPRPQVTTVRTGMTVVEALRSTRRSGHSRFPLIDEHDGLVGVVSGRELTDALVDGRGDELVDAFQHDLLVTPPTQPLDRLLARMRDARVSIAAVLDEYGQFDGIVTIEDIVEQVIGEIWDEDDIPGAIRRLPGGALVVAGSTPLAELEAEGIQIESDARSIAGAIQEALGSVPARGDQVTIGRYDARVLSTDGPRVRRVLLTSAQTSGRSRR